MKNSPFSKPSLQIQNLTIGYDKNLIENLNFELCQGESLIIYGPNGCGKSSLLKALLHPTKSQKKTISWNLKSEDILYISQNSSFPNPTPDDVESYLLNVLLYKKPFSRPQKSDRQKIQEVMQKLKLPSASLSTLSGGQKQKLKLARALLSQCQALLLDEPFNALDTQSITDMIHWLQEMQPETLQLIVLHELEQIERLRSRILWIQPSHWEILEFNDWFKKVDAQFHKWMQHSNSPAEKGPECLK